MVYVLVTPTSAGWICHAGRSAGELRDCLMHGGWIMPPAEAARIFGGRPELASAQTTRVSQDGRTVEFIPPDPGAGAALLAEGLRAQRDAMLEASDRYALPDYPLSPEARTAVFAYRQALRDLPAQTGWPEHVAWPEFPKISG